MTSNGLTPDIDWKEIHRREMRCEAGLHPNAVWVWRVNPSGRHLQFFCEDCDRPITRVRYPHAPGTSVTPDWLKEHCGVDADEVPTHRRGIRYSLCYLCGVTAMCEFHHIAPQAIYKEDADKYPVVPLCETCHDAETRVFTERLEAYVRERIRRYLSRQGGAA